MWNISQVLQLQNWIPNLHTNALFALTSIPTWLASDESDKSHKGLPWGLPTDQLPRHYSRCPIRSSYTKLISESSRGYRMTGGPEVWSALEDRKPRRLPGGVGGPALSLRLPRPRLTHSLTRSVTLLRTPSLGHITHPVGESKHLPQRLWISLTTNQSASRLCRFHSMVRFSCSHAFNLYINIFSFDKPLVKPIMPKYD